MVQLAVGSILDQDRKSKAAWQAALLRQLADDLERGRPLSASERHTTLLTDAVELPSGTQILFTLHRNRPPSVEVRGPAFDCEAFYVSVHP